MGFETMLQRNLGKNATIHLEGDFSGRQIVSGKLIKMERDFFCEGYHNPIPLDEVSSIREGKKLDIEVSDSKYFSRGFAELNGA